MIRNLVAGLSIALCGCSSMSNPEIAWQTLHLIDVAQTLNGPASDRCYREAAWPTESLIGEYPDRDAVLAWGVGAAIVHYFAGRWVDNSDWPDGVKLAIRSIDLSYKGATVWQNHKQGIRPFGDNVSCEIAPSYRPGARPVK